jgi:UPF0755 protein
MWWQWASRPKATGTVKPVLFAIEKGQSLQSVASQLEERGLIRSAVWFRYLGKEATLQPGTYQLVATDPPTAILSHLQKGDVATVRVTFPEGWTVRQIAKRLAKNNLIPEEQRFLTLVTEQGQTLEAGFDTPKNLEGYLFPDTYFFPLGATEKQIAETMLRNFKTRVIDGLQTARPNAPRPLSEVINVAAMVEREAEVDKDRPLVAGVIYNRLKKGMRLQIDATVQYARGIHENRLLYKHLEVDSPYNTYKNAGLPPGPICCPGLPSIEAALKPKASDYLFYVDAGLGTGEHLFATTYAEHQRNVALFRQRRRAAEKATTR